MFFERGFGWEDTSKLFFLLGGVLFFCAKCSRLRQGDVVVKGGTHGEKTMINAGLAKI